MFTLFKLILFLVYIYIYFFDLTINNSIDLKCAVFMLLYHLFHIQSLQSLPLNLSQYHLISHYTDLPSSYPVGRLLGCVNVVDVMPQEDYRQEVFFSNFFFPHHILPDFTFASYFPP